jgi:hypothetical protein
MYAESIICTLCLARCSARMTAWDGDRRSFAGES